MDIFTNLRKVLRETEDNLLRYYDDRGKMDFIIKSLENYRDSLKKILEGDSGESIIDPNKPIIKYHGYPIEGTFREKLMYIEDIEHRVWRRKDIDKLILEIEGDVKGRRTISNSAQKIGLLLKDKELIGLKYNKSNKYCFYTTRQEWIEKNYDGEGHHRLLEKHEPHPLLLDSLTPEQKQNESIEWTNVI